MPDDAPAPLSADELADVERDLSTLAISAPRQWPCTNGELGQALLSRKRNAEALDRILIALPRLLATAQREAALLALRGWAEAAEAWMTHALSIAEERRVLSNDVVADGRGIRAALIFALDDVVAEPREPAP